MNKGNQLQSLQFQVYNSQVSGKQPKLLTKDQRKILKGFNLIENQFYEHLNNINCSQLQYSISTFIPKYYGVIQLQHSPILNVEEERQAAITAWLTHLSNRYKKKNVDNKFIVLQNITFGWQVSNVFDIKIGGRNVEGKRHKITQSVLNYNIKLNGCKITFPKGQKQSIFLSKYYLSTIIDLEGFVNYFGLFFFNGQSLNLSTIRVVQEKLIDLILRFKAVRGFKFFSSSLLLAYDAARPANTEVKFLDFGRVEHRHPGFIDEETTSGLENMLRIVMLLRQSGDSLYKKITQLQQYCSKAQIMVIPQKKIQQFPQQQQ